MRKTGVYFVLAALLCSRELIACAPAPHPGESIAIVEESAVILWEPATKTQHFIRRATFRGEASDFGFLVPTPTAPTLAEVDDGVFDQLQRKTSRQVVNLTETVNDWTPLILRPFRRSARHKGDTVTAAAPVEVLSTQRIAGYQAAVLDATDAQALLSWLTDNGYATTPDLDEWLGAYIEKQWIISAFKIDKSQMQTAQTSAVRMTFTTERPFFPYREPASQREIDHGARMLRIWFLGPDRVKGIIGADQTWPGETLWSDAARDLETAGVKMSAGTRLTAFEDTSSPRPGTDDLFFSTDPDQKTIVPPPYEITSYETRNLPVDLFLAPVVIAGLWMRRIRRTRRRGTPPTEPRDGSPDRRSDG